ncbi:MAG TPA: hypothetical protein VMH61_04870 [Candidatus Acidoferrales bacterium]|nr:hypothetical protein [Candidatus Acidoferrales bacterium]
MSESESAPKLGRREFLTLVGAAGIASIAPSAALAAVADSTHAAPPAAAAPSGPSEDAKALTGILKRRFPDRLSEAEWDRVTGDLDGRLSAGRRMAEHKLANGDEPDFTFHA